MSTTNRTIPTRGEMFTLPAECWNFTNSEPMEVFVTYAKRSEKPTAKGACVTHHLGSDEPIKDEGWYIEYRTLEEGPLIDANTPGLHAAYVSDAWL